VEPLFFGLKPSQSESRSLKMPDPAIQPASRRKVAIPRGDRSRKRCAIYTRRSSEEGLEQEFDSLQAQHEGRWWLLGDPDQALDFSDAYGRS
jgi:hypothetical protein